MLWSPEHFYKTKKKNYSKHNVADEAININIKYTPKDIYRILSATGIGW